MKMQFFWIPALDSQAAETELNQFLANARVIHLDKEFAAAPQPGWSVCVQYEPSADRAAPRGGGGGTSRKVDYREVLDEETFAIFAALRTWRKETAAEDGVPLYTVATNEQLAAMARDRVRSVAELERIDGFGGGRRAKYGKSLLAVCEREMPVNGISKES